MVTHIDIGLTFPEMFTPIKRVPYEGKHTKNPGP
jgi:hypothetical protein